jgi:hypothetical protein
MLAHLSGDPHLHSGLIILTILAIATVGLCFSRKKTQ